MRLPFRLAFMATAWVGGVGWCASAVAAPILLGAGFDGTIYDVDTTTGAVSNPRDTGIPWLCGIEFDVDGNLKGSDE